MKLFIVFVIADVISGGKTTITLDIPVLISANVAAPRINRWGSDTVRIIVNSKSAELSLENKDSPGLFNQEAEMNISIPRMRD